MKVSSPISVGSLRLIFSLAIILVGSLSPAYCEDAPAIALYETDSGISLMVQQTPDDGGATNPVRGVYHLVPDSQVTLTATPSPGYKFSYWLGDVSDPQSTSTVVLLNRPKVVVAVFEQIDQTEIVGTAGGGGGGGFTSFTNTGGLAMGGGLSGTTGAKPKTQSLVYAPSGDNIPEVPEPATGLLLTIGSLFALSRGRKKKPNLS